MRNQVVFFLSFFASFCALGQTNKSTQTSDLKTFNSPGFQLLDISPSSIERPTNPKEFSVKVLSLLNDGNAIPKNYAFEVSPFWFFKSKNESIYKYLGVGEKLDSNQTLGTKLSSGIFRKASLSLSSTFNDSTSGSLLSRTNYVAFGIRTNLLTIRTAVQNNKINAALLEAAKRMDDVVHKALDAGKSLNEAEELLDSDKSYNDEILISSKLPLLQLDGAFAYSDAFAENSFDNRRFNRSGIWATLALNADFTKRSKNNHSLSFIILIKTLRDNLLVDTNALKFERSNLIDFGGKIEYNVSRLCLSIEYIERKNKDFNKLNSDRIVGVVQYKIGDKLYATGTYGKNFGEFKNLFTLLGLNWGFGESKLK